MKAMVLNSYGETATFEAENIDEPKVSEGHVLVRIAASSVNTVDTMIRQMGQENLPLSPDLPAVLGMDFAGTVEAVGEGASGFTVGDEVYGCAGGLIGLQGTLTELINADARLIAHKPKSISMREAAALPLGGLTAYRAVFTHGKLLEGENVLISGVGGGVAQFAFQFAVATGASVYVTSGSVDKINKCVELGAKGGFNYKEDWNKQAMIASGGFDLVIDSAGGDQINDFIKMMKPAGRIVFYGATNGMPSKLDVFKMFWNQITLQGSTMANDDEFKAMIAYVKKNRIEPIIDSVRQFDEIVDAFDKMKDGKQFGKLVARL